MHVLGRDGEEVVFQGGLVGLGKEVVGCYG